MPEVLLSAWATRWKMKRPLFFVGMHQPHDTWMVPRCIVSINRLRKRQSGFPVNDWMMDSGAFTRVTKGHGHLNLREYASHIQRWSQCGNLLAAVAQDYMCEPFVTEITGMSVADHQDLTVARYRALKMIADTDNIPTHIMPVLQGFQPEEYANHVRQYGNDLTEGMWVGVGSVCKRNGSPRQVELVLDAIQELRPDLRLHGFGIKKTALAYQRISEGFYSADSMAWSYAARMAGGNSNDPEEAVKYTNRIENLPIQMDMHI